MTRKDLLTRVYFSGTIPRDTVEAVYDRIIHEIKAELLRGGEVNLIGFGKFSVKEYAAREGVNPRPPHEKIQLPASKRPYFTASKSFKEAVNR